MSSPMLGWKFCNAVNNTVPSKANKNANSSQGERWHLYTLHDTAFSSLINSLATECALRQNANVTIEASTSWIDAHPQAHWYDRSQKEWRNVEVADLLLVVSNQTVGKADKSRRAMLLQGKWTDSVIELGRETLYPGKKDPSNKERDLLEIVTGPIHIYKAHKRQKSSAIPKKSKNKFSLSNLNKSLIECQYARYLLFPKEQQGILTSVPLPYQTLSPSKRNKTGGNIQHYEALLTEMGQPTGTSIPCLDDKNHFQWKEFVESIVDWIKQKNVDNEPIKRFKANFNAQNNHTVQAIALMTQQVPGFSNFLSQAGRLPLSYDLLQSDEIFRFLSDRLVDDPTCPNTIKYLEKEINYLARFTPLPYREYGYPFSGMSSSYSPSDEGLVNGPRKAKFLVVDIAVSYGDPLVTLNDRIE